LTKPHLHSRNLLILIALSLAFALLHSGPLYGTVAALVLTMLTQLYLPGWLLARALGKHAAPHPVSRFAWMLAAGTGLVISLGGILRLLHVPVSTYVLVLHAVMVGLALLGERQPEPEAGSWRLTRQHIPLYLLLLVCCIAVTIAGYERSRIRFNNFADQTVFVGYADWLATMPESPEISVRMAGTIRSNGEDVRLSTDGWTYNNAAWVWTSGVSAVRLLWYDITPLFVWTIPLVFFALGYEISGRETTAAWGAAALTLFGLMTADSLVYRQNNLAFGQYALLQLNTLRMASRALVLPLALFAALAYLQAPRWRDLLPVFLAGMAVAMMHPQQVMIFLISMGGTGAVWWLAQPTRIRLRQATGLAVVLASLLALPYIQRAQTTPVTRYTEQVTEGIESEEDAPAHYSVPWYVLPVKDVPVIGTTYVISPPLIFYHPVILLAVILGLGAGLWWRKNLASQYLFGSTAAFLMVLFVPGMTALTARVTALPALPGMVFGFPVAVTLGVALDLALRQGIQMWNRWSKRRAPGHWFQKIGSADMSAVILMAAILLLLFEPVPIPASARDQIQASNELQALRDMHATDQQLLDSLTAHVPRGQMNVLLTPNPVANYVLESVPGAVVTGGRRGMGNKWAFDATLRFFSDDANLLGKAAPWLDDLDLGFLAEYGVSYIVLEARDTRLPQLLFQPERFELLDQPAGYLVFRVVAPIQPDSIDARFQQMNLTYGEQGDQRWNRGVFELNRPANPIPWEDFAGEWSALLERDPENDRARYGLAVAETLMGEDERALALWQTLHERYPQVGAFVEAVAYTQLALGRGDEAVQTLVRALNSDEPAVRLLAARHLLTADFFYGMEGEELEQVVAVTQAAPDAWEQLGSDSPDDLRRQASLLIGAGMLDAAADWLERLPKVETTPSDLTTLASIALAQGDVERALALLQPAEDADATAAQRFLHPDRWENNTAAQMYELLRGGSAYQERHWNEAEDAYQRAMDWGAADSVQYLVEQAQAAERQPDQPPPLYPACAETPNSVSINPWPIPPLRLADTGALYTMDVSTLQNEDDHTLTVCATFGDPTPPAGYVVRRWRIQIVSLDAATQYASLDVPAQFIPGALTRASVTLRLPEDIPPLTPALVYIEPMYNPAIPFEPSIQPVVLNRPAAAEAPPDAIPGGLHFGDSILLRSYTASEDEDHLQVTLYWEASAPLPEDYQVFVHVVDGGQIVAQDDSGPANNRYPTSQWRAETLIEDIHTLPFNEPLPPGTYRVLVGLYRLQDGARLPVTPADERVEDDSVQVYTFSQE